jgi:Isopropylmalate/homocitrate/citramalate synthases
MDNAIEICERVIDAIGATPEKPIILNLPNTVEMCTPNTHADQIEYFIRNMKHRDCAIISLHPHNDRGTAVAAAELGVLAGADRVEGTLFGNGERTGNLDIVTMAMNMYSQGIDPKLDFAQLPKIRKMYEECTNLSVHQRHPYAGELVFTAFSGSHQDAINKGKMYMEESQSEYWEVPYLPIDPADVGREYEPIIRINSQSGKGGAAFVMNRFGYQMPKAMHPEFGQVVTHECDVVGKEISAERVKELFEETYLQIHSPYELLHQRLYEEDGKVHFEGVIRTSKGDIELNGYGNGPIDAFFQSISGLHIDEFQFVSYNEHAISTGSDSKGVAYIELKDRNGQSIFGVGIAENINHAANIAIIRAIDRGLNRAQNEGE